MNVHRDWNVMGAFAIGAFIALLSAASAPAADPAPLELVQTIVSKGKPGKLDYLGLDVKRNRLFLANKVNNTLDIFDLKENKLLQQIPNQFGIQGVAHAADLDRVFTALGTGGFCNIFDGNDYKLLKTVKFEDDADNLRYNQSTHLVYVAHAEKALGVIDAKTYEVKADIKLPGAAEGFQPELGRPRLYVNVPSPSQVVVIDTDKNEVSKNYPLKLAGQNVPLALDEANHRILIGCRKPAKVVVMDSESGKEMSSVDIPSGIDGLYFDAKRKRIYASCGEGFLAVLKQVDADHYELLEKIATAKDAKTCYFDPDSGRVFVGIPRQEGKGGPEIRVYQAKP